MLMRELRVIMLPCWSSPEVGFGWLSCMPSASSFIHRERIWQAEQLFRQMDSHIGDGHSDSVDLFIKLSLLNCAEG
eukprot:scaffold144589_cov39-Prasinocladus_malaysianus.AAC.2